MERTTIPALLNGNGCVTLEYAAAHTQELLEQVNRDASAIRIDAGDLPPAVLVPEWWYMLWTAWRSRPPV